MNLTEERLKELANPSPTADERALARSRACADLVHTGQYERAHDALGELWRGVGERPRVEGLGEAAAAEVLLQAGALSGRMGASRQASGAQEKAKDLISESAALFERVGEASKAALARSDLALCYWREGAYDEARLLLEEAYARADGREPKVKVALRLAVVESCAGRYGDAFRLLSEVAPLLEASSDHALRGSLHNELAILLRRLGTAEQRADYFDRAILEYTASVYHYEQAGHERYAASIKNNLAFLLHKLGRHEEALEQLDGARAVPLRLRDAGLLSQVDETRARVLIAQGRCEEASDVIAGAVETLERGGEAALLADALTVQGVAWARLEVHEESLSVLCRAMSVAEEAGASHGAALAALTLIEEHGASRLARAELYELYRRADELLKDTQDAEHVGRLRACARVVARRLSGARLDEEDFSLPRAVQELEASLIGQALEEAGGSVTKAARLLGIPYQSLIPILNTRHRNLRDKRTPARNRRRSIFRVDRATK